jgi:predicted  nucleic acid-binding Zn-ribbon protein
MATSNVVDFSNPVPSQEPEIMTPRGTKRGTKAGKQGTGNVSPRASTQTGVAAIMDQLDRLQSQQITFSRKVDSERDRREKLETKIRDATNAVNYYRDATKNGSIVKDDEMVKMKLINKLEYQIGEARNKLSAFRKRNQILKTEIIEGRQEKLMHLTIHKELTKDIKDGAEVLEEYKEEINVVNNRKQRKEVEISNSRHQIFEEMENFSNEMSRAKRSVAKTQGSILDGIREKLQLSMSPLLDNSPKKIFVEPEPEVDEIAVARAQKIKDLLSEVGADSLEDIIVSLSKAEEEMYQKYHDIQEMTEEMEKLDVSNKHLESDLESENSKLTALEANSAKQTRELEGSIHEIRDQIKKCAVSYDKNMFVLNSVQSDLMTILTAITIDGDATDKSLQVTGVNDRNIPEFLGRVEERIDTLIQMNKAANHIGIQREDFIRLGSRQKAGKVQKDNFAPSLPSLMDEYEDKVVETQYDHEKVFPIDVSQLKDFMRRKVVDAEAEKRETESPSPHKNESRKISMSNRGSTVGGNSLKTQHTAKASNAFAGIAEEKDQQTPPPAASSGDQQPPAAADAEADAPLVPQMPSTERPGTGQGGRPGTGGRPRQGL